MARRINPKDNPRKWTEAKWEQKHKEWRERGLEALPEMTIAAFESQKRKSRVFLMEWRIK